VDGNDVIAVRHAMDEALARARSGAGPALIEALTYRLSDHTTADDASRYRSPDELAEAWKLDPILRLRACLVANGTWDKAREDALLKECNERIQAAAQAYLDTPPPPPAQMFDHLYATLPAALQKQRATALGEG
jgi:pyruvate dehydrogenase E1 component alpha subunit